MRHLRRAISAFRNLLFRSRADRDLGDELQAYVDLVADEHRANGTDAARAARAARVALGGIAPVTQAVREARTGAGVERLWQDVHYALRSYRRSPGFTAAAVTTLALGIGANAAMFSVIDAAMFKPLPYSHSEQLVDVAYSVNVGKPEETHFVGSSWKQIDRWRAEPQMFSEIVTFTSPRPVAIPDLPSAGPARMGRVSPQLLALLGVRPHLGRWFVDDDAKGQAVALISEDCWTRALGRDPNVLGRTLIVDRLPRTIVGVMPPTFSWGVGGGSTVGWLPFDERTERVSPGSRGASTLFRLRDGLTFPEANRLAGAASPRVAGQGFTAELLPFDSRLRFGSSNRQTLPVLMGVTGLVLLIACANVANLLTARAFVRRRELAVRAAIGASRRRLVRQMLTEGLVLAVMSGAAGLGLAAACVAWLPVLIPPRLGLFVANPMALDGRVLGVCAVAILATTLLCSLIPAIRASRVDLLEALEGSTHAAGTTSSGRRLRQGLQGVEVALTLVLLSGVGLLASSFMKMVWAQPGFDVDRLAVGYVSVPAARYPTPAAQREFFDALLASARSVGGVEAASYGAPPPGGGSGRFVAFGRENDAALTPPQLRLYTVDADYFATAGIPVREGRLFTAEDRLTSPPVALIDDKTAQAFWPNQSPIGRRFRYSQYVPWITVIGVVGHVKTKEFTATIGTAQAYLPISQSESANSRALLIRADPQAATTALGTIRSVIHGMDAAVDLQQPQLVADMYDDVFVAPRFNLLLMSLFASLALLTAAFGLFGLLNYAVSQRTREIGVRLALGAGIGQIRALIVRDALVPVAGGIVAGLGGAFWLTRYLESQLFGVTPHDVRSYAGAVALLLAVAVMAAYLPARRATNVNPATTLRVG